MIALTCLDYTENLELDLLITKYVNENLEEMIHCVLDDIEESSDTELFSPARLNMRSPDECLMNIKELLAFTVERGLRKDLSPIYQYHLFKIIEWCIEIFGDIENGDISHNAPIVINEMTDDLRQQVIKQYGEESVAWFTDIREYLQDFFHDWDFLPSFSAGAVQLYLDNSALFNSITTIKELEEYVDLMDGDTYRKFQKIQARIAEEELVQEERYIALHEDVKNALLSIQKNSQYWGLDENCLNDVVCGLLGMKYRVNDQSRQGQSLSGKSAGEVDFLVWNENEPMAIMEALVLDSLKKEYISDHINKLLVNYDPQGYPLACLIMYVTRKNFGDFWEEFSKYISEYKFPYPVYGDFVEGDSVFSESRNAHMVLLRSNRYVLFSIFAIHLREKESQ